MLEYLVYKSMREGFVSLFENVVLQRSLKSFFQLDQQVDIRLYLSQRLPHSTIVMN
jgi:hypothetical protein